MRVFQNTKQKVVWGETKYYFFRQNTILHAIVKMMSCTEAEACRCSKADFPHVNERQTLALQLGLALM